MCELIVTQWDVNSTVLAMAALESGELIVTQWDVNKTYAKIFEELKAN